MITLKSSHEIDLMRRAGKITAAARALAGERVRPGVTTQEIDSAVEHFIRKEGAVPSFLHYNGFPASACISINDEVIHGIPSKKRFLHEGDIVKVDVGAFYKGFHGDAARTIPVGKVSEEAEKLIKVTRDSFFAGIERFQVGNRLGDIGHAIDSLVVANGFSTVKKYIGHGIGHNLHESPDVPNYGTEGRGTRLCAGMVLAIEPMVNVGVDSVKELSDGWTVKTADGKLSAHYENTVALTSEGLIVMTQLESDF